MNRMLTVFKYELKSALKSKTFIISNIIFLTMIIAMGLFAKFNTSSSLQDSPIGRIDEIIGSSSETGVIGVVLNNDGLDKENVEKIYPEKTIKDFSTEEELKEKISNEEIEAGLVFNKENSIKIIYNKAPTFTMIGDYYSTSYKNFLVDEELRSKGTSLEEINNIQSGVVVNTEVESLKEDNTAFTMIISTVMSVIIYILIIMNGQIAAMNVAREKNDRTMELLITSTDPKNLINGKVLASFFQSMASLIILLIGGGISLFINKEMVMKILEEVKFNIDPTFIGIFIVFFIIGYIMYLYLYAALGATVSNTEEVNTAMGPLMIIVVAVYLGSVFALSNPNPNNLLLKILSYIPFSSMFTIHARYALTGMPLAQVGISLGILVVTTIILSIISIRIYRSASLNYGNRNKLFNRIKRIFKK